jgi:hypothetical protein
VFHFVSPCLRFVLLRCGYMWLQTLLWHVFCVAELFGSIENVSCLCSGASKSTCSKPPCWLFLCVILC